MPYNPPGFGLAVPHTPTFTSGGGTVTGATIGSTLNYAYNSSAKLLRIDGVITLTNIGSGVPTGAFNLSLPLGLVGANSMPILALDPNNSQLLFAYCPAAGSGIISIFKAAAVSLWANGAAAWLNAMLRVQ